MRCPRGGIMDSSNCRSMAAVQLYGSGLVARWRMRSLEGLPPLPLLSRVSFSRSVVLRSKYCRVPSIGVFNNNGRKLFVSMSINGNSSGGNIDTIFAEDKPSQANEPLKSSPIVEPLLHVQKDAVVPTKRSAKIHDFCLGIPFGGFLFAGGLLGFMLSRNATGMIFGGAILALSVLSLKVWSSGRSSLPFILGQAALSAVFIWKHLRVYSSSKKLFPSGLYIFLSAAMICFYSYVLISGGNPPPKKLAAAASPS